MAILVWLALCIGEAAGPLCGDTGLEPAFDEVGEVIASDGEELGTVIEGAFPDPPSSHPTADAAAFVQNRNGPTFLFQGVGREQTGDAGSHDDAGFLVFAHVW
jgi:hypothetical protein